MRLVEPLTVARAQRIGKEIAGPLTSRLTPEERCVEQRVLADAEAHRSLEFLSRKRIEPRTLIRWLTQEAVGPVLMNLPRRAFLSEPGNWPEVKRLCGRLRRDADRIERINRDTWPSPIRLVRAHQKLSANVREEVAGDFRCLPEILRWYALFGEASLVLAHRERKASWTGNLSRIGTERSALLCFLEKIHRTAGKCYFERTAALITAARETFGRRGETKDTLNIRWRAARLQSQQAMKPKRQKT